jgi:enoyl-CoA hydratase/carnithine racemase
MGTMLHAKTLREAHVTDQWVQAEVVGGVGVITLNRPKALNALSLGMVRNLMATLVRWRDDESVLAVMLRGSAREMSDGSQGATHFCAGGDIRFMHEAGVSGDLAIDDFFTEEYDLDHFIHAYPKPVIAWLDGIVMGGGMGLAQGATLRVATPAVKMAMPETRIGLIPDVAGGHFLSRLPGSVGEYLGIVGQTFNAHDALHWRLVDGIVSAQAQAALLQSLKDQAVSSGAQAVARVKACCLSEADALIALPARGLSLHEQAINQHFSLATVEAMAESLRKDGSEWALSAHQHLQGNSPLMMKVTLRQIRMARHMGLAEVFRLERNLVRQCFALRKGAASETVEGVRALAVDKDHQPRWNPVSLADVSPAQVDAFFEPPWPSHIHPLRHLMD